MTVIDPYENPEGVDAEVAAVVEEAAPEYTDLSLQRRFRVIFGLGIAVVLLMGWLLIRAATSGDELDNLRAKNDTLTATNSSQQVLIDKLATQLDDARAQGAAVPTPEVVAAQVPGAEVSPPVQGERGEAGLPGVSGERGLGPTDDQVAAAFIAYCAVHRCVGADGKDGVAGKDGKDGADSQVPGLTGQNGADGAPGQNGADSQAPGPQGLPGADSQVPGPQGVPGQTPTAMDCTPSNPLDFSQPWDCVVTAWSG